MSSLLRPLITKKVAILNERRVYGFIVDKRATKTDIKQAVERAYGVAVSRVNTLLCASRRKTRYTKLGVSQSRRHVYKKALVMLKEGGIIDFYSNTH